MKIGKPKGNHRSFNFRRWAPKSMSLLNLLAVVCRAYGINEARTCKNHAHSMCLFFPSSGRLMDYRCFLDCNCHCNATCSTEDTYDMCHTLPYRRLHEVGVALLPTLLTLSHVVTRCRLSVLFGCALLLLLLPLVLLLLLTSCSTWFILRRGLTPSTWTLGQTSRSRSSAR